MLAKLTVFGKNRQEALDKMVALLRDYVLLGVRHNLDFLRFTLESPAFQSGHYHTHSVAQLMPEFLAQRQTPPALALVAALLAPDRKQTPTVSPPGQSMSPWQSLKGYSNV
jgi:acetyl/propionyl-CoA carboxylase alpha subunit